MDQGYTLDQYLEEEYNYKLRTTPTVPLPIQLAIQTCNCNRCIPFGNVKKCEQKYETMSQRLADKLLELKKEAKKTFSKNAQTILGIRNNAEKERKENEKNLRKRAIPVFEHEMEKELLIFEKRLRQNRQPVVKTIQKTNTFSNNRKHGKRRIVKKTNYDEIATRRAKRRSDNKKTKKAEEKARQQKFTITTCKQQPRGKTPSSPCWLCHLPAPA